MSSEVCPYAEIDNLLNPIAPVEWIDNDNFGVGCL